MEGEETPQGINYSLLIIVFQGVLKYDDTLISNI